MKIYLYIFFTILFCFCFSVAEKSRARVAYIPRILRKCKEVVKIKMAWETEAVVSVSDYREEVVRPNLGD